MGTPGQQYFAGTHLNPNVTWWSKSKPFFDYLNRCQFLLQQGLFVADVCYYYGDHVPNFARLKSSDPARVLPGFDYDVITEEASSHASPCATDASSLPDGIVTARGVADLAAPLLSPPSRSEKIRQLVADGATVIGRGPPEPGASQVPRCDAEAERIAVELGERPRNW
jgi:hypothetical protein